MREIRGRVHIRSVAGETYGKSARVVDAYL